jgi:uncharacterized protein with HEPN domain/predicted nucleotidyltransferase
VGHHDEAHSGLGGFATGASRMALTHNRPGDQEAREMTYANLLKRHREEIRAIVEAHGASNPRVFGSVRYGVDTSESDIDLLVDPEPNLSLFDLAAIQGDLRELLGVEVDVLTPNGLPERIRARVLAEAEAIVEGDYGSGGNPSMRDKTRRLPDYIEDILKEIDLVKEFISGVSREDFIRTRIVQHAVVRSIEVVGEASANIRKHTPAFQQVHPDLPLKRAHDMRNQLIHGYSDIDLDIVWNVATEDLPKLKEMLLAIRQAEGLGDD